MCNFQVSGCGKGYVSPDKKTKEALSQAVEAATEAVGKAAAQTDSCAKPGEAHVSIGDRIKIAGEKIGKIDTEIFKDFFASREVVHAKSLIKDMAHTSAKDKGKLADQVKEFDDITSKMSNGELVEVAQHLNELMRNTDGNDDLYGSLLEGVLDKLDKPAKGRLAPPPGLPPIWDEKIPDNRHFPWDEKLPGDFRKFDRLDNKFQHNKVLIAEGKVDQDIF